MVKIQKRTRRRISPGFRFPRRGAIVVLAAFMMIVLVAMVAFTIDFGYIVHARTELQRTADACALAAARHLPDTEGGLHAAQAVASSNVGMVGPALTAADVEFGYWDQGTATFTASSGASINAVRVTVLRTGARGNPLRLFLGGIFGTEQVDVSAEAIAMFDWNLCGPLVGIDWISIPGGPFTDSYLSGEGHYLSQAARQNGNLCSDGPILLDGNAIVNGHANPGRGYATIISGNALVTGSTSPRLRPLELPDVDMREAAYFNGNDDLPLIQKGNSWVSPVDANGNFLLDGNRTYTIPEGTYYLNDFRLTGSSTLNFEGPTTLYLTGNLDTSGGELFNHTQLPNNLKIYMRGGTARVTAKVDFYGVVYAPNTELLLDGGGEFYGALVGRTLELTGNNAIHYDEDLDLENDVEMPKRVVLVQ